MEGLYRFLPNLTPNHAFQRERSLRCSVAGRVILPGHTTPRDLRQAGQEYLWAVSLPSPQEFQGEHKPLQIRAGSWESGRSKREVGKMTPKPSRCASGGSYPGCASWIWRARECASSWNSRRRHSAGRSAAGSGGGHTHDRRMTWPKSQKRELWTWGSQRYQSKVIPTGTAREEVEAWVSSQGLPT